jgi:hypothetical protein
VFRFTEPPTVQLDDEATNRIVTEQWERLKTFLKTWFRTADGKFKLAFHSFKSVDAFEVEIEKLLRGWLEEKVLKGRSPQRSSCRGRSRRGAPALHWRSITQNGEGCPPPCLLSLLPLPQRTPGLCH